MTPRAMPAGHWMVVLAVALPIDNFRQKGVAIPGATICTLCTSVRLTRASTFLSCLRNENLGGNAWGYRRVSNGHVYSARRTRRPAAKFAPASISLILSALASTMSRHATPWFMNRCRRGLGEAEEETLGAGAKVVAENRRPKW